MSIETIPLHVRVQFVECIKLSLEILMSIETIPLHVRVQFAECNKLSSNTEVSLFFICTFSTPTTSMKA
jgi:hypothetical protein